MINCPCCGAMCRWVDLAAQEKLKLFLAAPDLLEALKRIECQLGLCNNQISPGDDFHKLIQKAIAKAEGK